MEKIIARVLSFLFHPLLVPSYFLLILFQLSLPEATAAQGKFKTLLWLFVFTMTFMLPILFSFLLWGLKYLKSLQMQEREERMLPMVAVAVFYYFTFYALKQLPIFPYFKLFMVGSTVLVLLGILINYFYKISLHLIAWGGFTAALIGLSFQLHLSLFLWLFLVIFISGLTGYARLQCKAHYYLQINLGFLLGFVVMLALFLI